LQVRLAFSLLSRRAMEAKGRKAVDEAVCAVSKKAKHENEPAPPAQVEQLTEFEEKLEEMQEKLDDIEHQAAKEVLALQQRFNKMRAPLYTERAGVIKNIPNFWNIAVANHAHLMDALNDSDVEVMKYLDFLNVEDTQTDDSLIGFRIDLGFKTNPFFKNEVLTKDFKFSEDGEFVSVNPCKIDWKEGKDLTIQNVDDDQNESFFSFWFDKANEDTKLAEWLKDIFADPAKHYHNLVQFDDDGVFQDPENDENAASEEDDDAP